MTEFFPAPAEPAVAKHQQTAETDQADAGITRDTGQTGDHPDGQQPGKAMGPEIVITADHKDERKEQIKRLRPKHRIDLEQTGTAEDKQQQQELITARDT